ncbi:hypothetical protein Tco_0655104 [Tanacetum coccineum]|uniref:Uncharacterized protein n=1 Tax=Tanacetum coccineum TaxID=301880 RepID=A0ABQ4X5Q5_9ASTR
MSRGDLGDIDNYNRIYSLLDTRRSLEVHDRIRLAHQQIRGTFRSSHNDEVALSWSRSIVQQWSEVCHWDEYQVIAHGLGESQCVQSWSSFQMSNVYILHLLGTEESRGHGEIGMQLVEGVGRSRVYIQIFISDLACIQYELEIGDRRVEVSESLDIRKVVRYDVDTNSHRRKSHWWTSIGGHW